MSGQTCSRCREHYNTHDSNEHRCPDQRELDDSLSERDERLDDLERRIASLEAWRLNGR